MTRLWKKLAALGLALTFALAPAAQAITPQALKDLLQEYYLNELPQEVLEAETVEDIINALGDPYTAYLNPEEFAAFWDTMSDGSIVGLGVVVMLTEDGMLVKGTYKDSPAEALGLADGDLIFHVEGGPEVQTGADIYALLRGEEGTEVTFRVRHADGREETCTTRLARIIIPATSTQVLEDGTTGVIYCYTFGQETLGHFVEGTEENSAVNLWIVDLRSNGGGDVYAATQCTGVFLDEGFRSYLRANGDYLYLNFSEQGLTTFYPAITLVGPNTASSAELFSMSMKDECAGMIIGSSTFGKGVAQAILTNEQFPDLLEEGEGVRITAYQSYGVNGNTAQNIGVIPDLLVDSDHAGNIALLFSSMEPEGDNTGWAQLQLGGWMWFVELSQAAEEDTAPYFGEMLSAIPPGCHVFLGTGSDWEETTLDAIAQASGAVNFEPRRFTDTEGSDCQFAADTLYTYGILQGMGDGAFRPEGGLTRAQLCALLVQALNLPSADSRTDFDDVPSDSWYAPYVKAAQAAGYVEGVGNNKFSPNTQVTHEQLITVLGRMTAELNLFFRYDAKSVPEETGVPAGYSSWAEPWVWLLGLSQRTREDEPISLLYAPLEDIDPKTPATRGETAMLLYSILHFLEIIQY